MRLFPASPRSYAIRLRAKYRRRDARAREPLPLRTESTWWHFCFDEVNNCNRFKQFVTVFLRLQQLAVEMEESRSAGKENSASLILEA